LPLFSGEKDVTQIIDLAASKIQETLKEDPKIIIVDIRTPEEFAQGHLAHAKNINFMGGSFEDELAKLDKSKTYMMHCRSGGRSTRSLPIWKKLGFQKVIHLNKGMNDIQTTQLPLEKGSAAKK
jgi:rhodanese-related sulfurtransferase